jgi:hypothetical protein
MRHSSEKRFPQEESLQLRPRATANWWKMARLKESAFGHHLVGWNCENLRGVEESE